MKNKLTLCIAFVVTVNAFAQVLENMSYQAVVRTADTNLVISSPVGIKLSILQGSISGTAFYVETQTPITNANGLVSLQIGDGIPVSGTLSAIDWATGPYFIKTETDPLGGINYTITETRQLLSVPYALHAKTANTGGIIETDPRVPEGTQTGDMQYWNGTVWITVVSGSENQILHFCNGVPTWGECPTDVINPTTGKTWLDRNLGASQLATSKTDPASYGDLYQWGRNRDGHERRNAVLTTELSPTDTPGHAKFILNGTSTPFDWRIGQNDNLWQGVSGINNPCPSGYRVPTDAEWTAERLSWASNDSNGAFASPLKLPVAGYRFLTTGSLDAVGSFGGYWLSTVNGINSRYAAFQNSSASESISSRAYGYSVRCIKD